MGATGFDCWRKVCREANLLNGEEKTGVVVDMYPSRTENRLGVAA
jgi:hypothetical protein